MSDELILTIVWYVYIFFNIFRLFAYVPQIVALAKEESQAKVISLFTYWMWVGANFSTGLYAQLKTGDTWLMLTSYLNGVCCLIVISMVIFKRFKYAPSKLMKEELKIG